MSSQKYRRLTAEYKAEIAAYYMAHRKTLVEMSHIFGVSDEAIASALRAHNISARKSGRSGKQQRIQLSKDQEQELISRYLAGESCESLRADFGMSWHGVNDKLKALGVELRKPGMHGTLRKVVDEHGYIKLWLRSDDPMYSMVQYKHPGGGIIPEHRLVMARHLGRLLDSNETVHHINGDRADNRIENLQLRQGRHGKGVIYRCNACGSHNIESKKIAE